MGFYFEHGCIHGELHGAIFMSNRATMKECLERELLGLPSGQAEFVQHVKAGMILFLFEFEKRELHGVFQACSDGKMNIVPHAFSSSGRQFPAQVKFTRIWHCSPLSENVFRDSIRENYFSMKKFHFGLSQKQVKKLLVLFSSRKLKDKPHQTQCFQSNVSKQIAYSKDEAGNADADDGFPISGIERKNKNAGDSYGTGMSTDYLSCSLRNLKRSREDSRSSGIFVSNEHVMDGDFVELADHSAVTMGRVRRSADVSPLSRSGERDLNFEPRLNQRCSSSHGLNLVRRGTHSPDDNCIFSSLENCPFASTLSTLEKDPFTIGQLQQTSLVHHSLEPHHLDFGDGIPRSKNLSYSPSHGDAVCVSTLPYRMDSPCHNIMQSSPGLSSKVLKHPLPRHHTAFPCMEKYSFLSHVQSNDNSIYPKVNYGWSEEIPLHPSERYRHSHVTSAFSPDPSHPKHVVRKSFNNDDPNVLSYRPSATTFLLDNNNSMKAMDETFTSHLPSDSLDPVAGQGEQYTMAEHDDSEKFGINAPTAEESYLQDVYQNFSSMYSDEKKNRKSVFSRVVFPSKEVEEHDAANCEDIENVEGDIDSSVDEVMPWLHQSHHKWVMENSKLPLGTHHGPLKTTSSRRQMTMNSKLAKHELPKISKEMALEDVPVNEEDVQVADTLPFVDFKRRSKVVKIQVDSISSDYNENGVRDALVDEKHRRRKLVRPKFSNKDLSNIVVAGIQNDRSKISENAVVPCVISHGSCEGLNINRGSDYDDEKAKSCGTCILRVNGDRKEASHDTGIQNMPSLTSSEDTSGQGKEPKVDGSLLHHIDTLHSLFREKTESGIPRGVSNDNGKEKFLQDLDLNNPCPSISEMQSSINVDCVPDERCKRRTLVRPKFDNINQSGDYSVLQEAPSQASKVKCQEISCNGLHNGKGFGTAFAASPASSMSPGTESGTSHERTWNKEGSSNQQPSVDYVTSQM